MIRMIICSAHCYFVPRSVKPFGFVRPLQSIGQLRRILRCFLYVGAAPSGFLPLLGGGLWPYFRFSRQGGLGLPVALKRDFIS